ncbi:MAG: hypothetical protein OHK0056_11150 [Bacteriovoracaceae bacterium]
MKFLIFLAFLIFQNKIWAMTPVTLQVSSQITLQSALNGEVFNLERQNFIKIHNPLNNLSNWYQEVTIVDDDGNNVTDEKFKVSQKYLFKAVSDQIDPPLPLIDTKNGLLYNSSPNTRFVVLGKEIGRQSTYLVVMVNEDGEILSKRGTPLTAPIDGNSIYKVNVGAYEEALMKSQIGTITSLQEQISVITRAPSRNCTDSALESSPRPKPKPERRPAGVQNTEPSLSPYKKLMDIRDSIKGKKNCLYELKKQSEKLLQETEWAGLSLTQRASKIFSMAKSVVSEVKKNQTRPSGNLYKDLFNPNILHPLLTPELLSCISFQETRGLLNPINMNYTFCKNTKGLVSTAHGLNHVVKKTLTWLKTHPAGDQIPMTSKFSVPYSDLDPKDLHIASSSSPELQLEIMLRVMNFNIKHLNWKNKGKLSSDELLKSAIIAYDQDSKSNYISNVLNRCLPCFNSAKDKNPAPRCYETLK